MQPEQRSSSLPRSTPLQVLEEKNPTQSKSRES